MDASKEINRVVTHMFLGDCRVRELIKLRFSRNKGLIYTRPMGLDDRGILKNLYGGDGS